MLQLALLSLAEKHMRMIIHCLPIYLPECVWFAVAPTMLASPYLSRKLVSVAHKAGTDIGAHILDICSSLQQPVQLNTPFPQRQNQSKTA